MRPSILATMVAGRPFAMRLRRTSGVFPMERLLSSKIGMGLSPGRFARQMLKSGTPEVSWTRRARSSSETPSSDAATARSVSVHK